MGKSPPLYFFFVVYVIFMLFCYIYHFFVMPEFLTDMCFIVCKRGTSVTR
jgi:hypothetical protein